MKAKEYVTKYELDEDVKFDHSAFVEDLKMDFHKLVETRKNIGELTLSSFSVAVKDIRTKFDSIKRGSYPRRDDVVWQKLWNYFYATVVCPTREKELEQVEVETTVGRMTSNEGSVQTLPKEGATL